MKKMIRISSLTGLLAFFFMMNSAMAQTAVLPSAHFDANLVLTIDPAAALSTEYALDFSSMAFKDENAVKIFFRGMTDNLVHWDYDYALKQATLHIHTQYQESWTVSNWNTFLQKNAERYRMVYTRANAE
jgi:hypothetical protein